MVSIKNSISFFIVEDNNTRVLFERLLTSEELPKEGIKYFGKIGYIYSILILILLSKIWSKFLDFECYCGDLSSVLKVDKKRQKALESVIKLFNYH
jgi:hypothetical protein